MNPRKKPKFTAWGSKYLKRIKPRWRKPRGKDSKLKKHEKAKGKMPSPGYGAPKKTKYLHPSGFKEVIVRNPDDLQKIDKSKHAGRIAHAVGRKKREMILKRAEELGIKILNR